MGAELLGHHAFFLHRAGVTATMHPTEALVLVAPMHGVAIALCVDIGAWSGAKDATIVSRWTPVLVASSSVRTAVTFACHSCGGAISFTTVVVYGLVAAEGVVMPGPCKSGTGAGQERDRSGTEKRKYAWSQDSLRSQMLISLADGCACILYNISS